MTDSTLTILQRVQQNHALEHATMHILARSIPGLYLVAFSDWAGFTVIGTVKTSALIDAATEALLRLRDGEDHLAVHPRCGTNLAVPLGLSGGLLLLGASLPRNWRFTRLFLVFLAGLGFGMRKPLSRSLQTYMTTITDLDQVHVGAVNLLGERFVQIHRVSLDT